MRLAASCSLVFLGSLLVAGQGWSRQRPAQTGDTTQAVPRAIPEPEIPRRSVQELTGFVSLRARLARDSSVAAIDTGLSAFVATIPEHPSDSTLASLSLLQLYPLRAERVPFLEQLEQWLTRVETRSRELTALGDTLHRIQQTWRVTRDTAAERGAPEAVQARIQAVLATADTLSAQLDRRVDEVLILLNRASTPTIELREVLNRIESATNVARTRLFEPDSPPLWTLGARATRDTTLAAQLKIAWQARAATVRGFVTRNWSRVGFHVLIFLALMAIGLALRRAAPAAADEESLRAPLYILHRPVAAAALLALLASGRIYPPLPLPVVSLLVVVALFVVVWLVRGLIAPWQRTPLYVLAALVLYERERLIIPEGTLLHRVLLLAGTVVTFIAFGWFLLLKLRHMEQRPWWRVVTVGLTRTALVLIGVAILANVAGLVRLADLVTSGVIWSAAFALLLGTAVLVSEGGIAIALRTNLARRLQVVSRHDQGIGRSLGRILRVLAAVWWVILVLVVFEVSRPLQVGIVGFLTRSRTLGSMEFRLADWLLFAVTLWAAVWLSRIIRYLLDEDVLPRLDLRRGIASLVSALTRYSLLGLGVVFALATAGIELSQLAFVAGALGVGIGFGLQNIVSNFVAGLVLLFERPIQPGDIIEVQSLFGEVKRIGVRSSTVRTFQGAEVIVPNASLITTNVVNWTLSDRLRRIEIDVGVAYGSDPVRVQALLLEVAKAHPDVLAEPAPMALFEGFGQSSLDFSLRCWTGVFDRFIAIRSEIRTGIHSALRDAEITIPFPQRDLHIKSVAPEAGATLRESGD